MRIAVLSLALGLAGALTAQQQLTVNPAGNVFVWTVTPPAGHTYFDLTVNTTVTIQGLDVVTNSPAGTEGSMELWITNPGTTTWVGNTANPSVWSLRASGPVRSAGNVGQLANLLSLSCLSPGTTLQPGTYGVAVRYVGVAQIFVQGTGANQQFSNADMTVNAGGVQAGTFVGAAFQPYVFYGNIRYGLGAVPHACALEQSYGAGCYTNSASFYQEFTTAASASAALSNRAMTLLFLGTGYTAIPGLNTFIPPTAAATPLVLGDDNEVTQNLTNAFPYPGGVATQLFVHANGYVSVASNNTLPGGLNFFPEVQPFLNAPATGWWSWHDYNPTEAGSGQVVFEEVGTLAIVTWNGVESYPTTAANPSTFQFQFDTATGQVHYVWQTIDAVGGSTFFGGDDHLIGFSPGGPSPNVGPFDVTALSSLTVNLPETFPLKVAASAKPVLNTTINLDTSNETGQSVGVCFVCAAGIPAPGVDPGIIGMPGCSALVDINQGVGNLISNLGLPGTSMSVPLPVPNQTSLNGLELFVQSIWLDAAVNPFGALVSNGLKLVVGSF
jgi:hypothetical protein